MLNKIKIICALLCILIIQTTSAVFFSGEVLKPQILTKDNVTVVLLGDIHVDIDPTLLLTEKQQTDLLNIAKKYNAFLIVEDRISYLESLGEILGTTFLSSKFKKIMISPETSITKGTPLEELCKRARKSNIENVNIECRGGGADLDTTKVDLNIINKIKSFKEPNFQAFLKNLESKTSLSEHTWLELNTVYEFAKALQSQKHTLIIVAVGIAHLRPISEMIQKIYNFNIVFQKNLYKYIKTFGSTEKNKEILNKEMLISNQYIIDLPQFFDEALKAQPIRSRL